MEELVMDLGRVEDTVVSGFSSTFNFFYTSEHKIISIFI